MDWICLGASATAPQGYERAKQLSESATVITCNSGIFLEPKPDHYFAADRHACREFWIAAHQARQTGTNTITTHRNRQWVNCCEYLTPGQGEPTRDSYGEFLYSGLVCLDYACRHGATQILMAGMDGYRTLRNPAGNHFDSLERDGYTANHDAYTLQTLAVVKPRTQSIVTLWRDVEFVLIGSPNYDIEGDNWTVEQW